ncbi:MAG: TIGR00730 family Rossman fold protein, partial [Bacteroidales bacterium]|nr:TIGR00730 family Rossman fold protein [Bacteroidales bacterium]
VLDGGGRVTGIIPDFFSRKEIAHPGLLHLIYVPSMHERKRRMAEISDGFIALPGGYGTLDELFEITTWAQLDLHRKPVGILNAEGYFDELFRFMDHMSSEGFVRPAHQQMILRDNDPESLLSRMAAYEAPEESKWINLIKA